MTDSPDQIDLRAARWSVLGTIGVHVDGRAVPLTRQSQRVLGLLLQEPGRAVAAERLVPGGDVAPTSQVVNAARVAVSRLRSSLARAGLRDVLETAPRGYYLDVDPTTIDHVAFRDAVRAAAATPSKTAALQHLEHALGLWRGEPFGEFSADLELHDAALALCELERAAVDAWCTLVVDIERGAALIDRLESAVAQEPLREQRWTALILAQYRAGNQTAAIRAYDRAAEALREEVGLDPGPELRTLLDDILNQHPRLAWRPERSTSDVVGLHQLARAATLLGRTDEVADVLDLLGTNRVVVLTGYAGIGKTALAAEVASKFQGAAWAVPLGGVTDPNRIVVAVADAMGITDHVALVDRIASLLEESSGLLLLDNCEHVADEVAQLVVDVTSRARRPRLLITSRAELDIPGAFTFVVSPLAIGSRDAPGPAVLLAANAALIPPSKIADSWSTLEEICRRADGVPLILELLGKAALDSDSPVDGLELTTLEAAVDVAVESLPAEARHLVEVLRVLPRDVGVELLGELVGVGARAARRALGYAVRAGLAVQQSSPGGSRVRLLEPVRGALPAPDHLTDVVLPAVQRALGELAANAVPSVIDAVDTRWALLVDEEHELALWVLQHLDPVPRLMLAARLAPVWRTCSRHADGERVLAEVEHAVESAPALERARYWVARARVSPSFSARVPLVAVLRDAIATGEREGDLDLAANATTELAIGLGWSGAFVEASVLVDGLLADLSSEQAWARVTLQTLVAMSRGVLGDPARAASDLVELATAYRTIGHVGEVANNLYAAAGFARVAGSGELLREILTQAESLPINRFSAYPMAGLAFERARVAASHDDPRAGALLWEAWGLMQAHGEQRTASICRRELGTWRLGHHDAGGLEDLVHAALHLLVADPRHCAVALAAIVPSLSDDSGLGVVEAAIPVLARRPEGSPLDDVEIAMIDAHAGQQPDSFDEAALRAVLRRLVSAS